MYWFPVLPTCLTRDLNAAFGSQLVLSSYFDPCSVHPYSTATTEQLRSFNKLVEAVLGGSREITLVFAEDRTK